DTPTLLSVLDFTATPMGSRMMKQWLQHPLLSRKQIEYRQKCVEELLGHKNERNKLHKLLQSIFDMERLLGKIVTGRANGRDVINLKNSLAILTPIKQLLTAKPFTILAKTANEINILDGLKKEIENAIVEAPPNSIQDGGLIKPGFSKELDDLRDIADHGKDWIVNYQQRERASTGISSLKISYNKVFGYYIEVSKGHIHLVPEHYERKQTLVNAERYITPELKEYEEKVLSAEEQIQVLERELFEELQKRVMTRARDIQANARILAAVDIACALAEVAQRNDYTRPVLVDEPVLSLTDSRHPVVETLLPLGERFTPNDLEMDPETSQIHIITGPNMSGKSTFLRQVGLIVVLAQLGSFVPARAARIGMVDQVFTRVGASDNLAGGESTFLVEMVETAKILNNATARSLVLLDEIGRGTSTYDGLSIAWAVTEYMHQNPQVAGKTLFATHYHELVALADTLPRVKNFNVAVREHGQDVVFLRKIVPGGADKSYGIHVAQMAGLPPQVIRRAGAVLASLTSQDKGIATIEVGHEPDLQVDLFAAREQRLREDFEQIETDNLTPIEALNLLDKLKKKHGL
ncbi:MAG: DNA mismatch repair protein MutS, partial [Candidatus Marinimicrobia bacterium]|nr:DNA mismatch repair protein MutS [Candidatus Neomarinimicrobiota bacterium]